MTNREIDKEIAEKIMGWKFLENDGENDIWDMGEQIEIFKPTEDISDAWLVVEKITGNYRQAKDWMDSRRLRERQDAIYINEEQKLHGIAEGMEFVRVGTWYEHNRIDHIEHMLQYRKAIELELHLSQEGGLNANS